MNTHSLASSSGRGVVASSLLGRRRVQACLPRHACRAASALAPTATSVDDKYAIIYVGGLRQIVEEGRSFACSRDALEVEAGSKLQFDKVVAFKSGCGEYRMGKPYLDDVLVEAELVEEFTAGASVDAQPTLGRVLVTKISHTDAARRALEEAFGDCGAPTQPAVASADA